MDENGSIARRVNVVCLIRGLISTRRVGVGQRRGRETRAELASLM